MLEEIIMIVSTFFITLLDENLIFNLKNTVEIMIFPSFLMFYYIRINNLADTDSSYNTNKILIWYIIFFNGMLSGYCNEEAYLTEILKNLFALQTLKFIIDNELTNTQQILIIILIYVPWFIAAKFFICFDINDYANIFNSTTQMTVLRYYLTTTLLTLIIYFLYKQQNSKNFHIKTIDNLAFKR